MTKATKSAAQQNGNATGDNAMPAACGMGRMYRFIEPCLLSMLAQRGDSYGYELHERIASCQLATSPIERAALYRTLRTLEGNGFVRSRWDAQRGSPARRIYTLTSSGRSHLQEWTRLLEALGQSMIEFCEKARANSESELEK